MALELAYLATGRIDAFWGARTGMCDPAAGARRLTPAARGAFTALP